VGRMAPQRLTIADRGPGWSYRPDATPPSIHGRHQPGIATPMLDHLVLAAFDARAEGTDDLRALLAAWSAEAEALMKDGAGSLTLTLGLGPHLFGDRHGLRAQRPAALHELPAFPGDALDPAFCGGDLVVQCCADDSAAAGEGLRRLTAAAHGAAAPRWTQTGHLRREPGDAPRGRARDPLGFRDGTHNLRRGRDLDRHVWADAGERTWMAGGTYLVVRRIELAVDAWERLPLDAQERAVGRHRATGAPLGMRREFDPMRFDHPSIPEDAHVRQAAPGMNAGASMLRRSYSYGRGDRDGLVFLAYQRDPRRQFVPVQRRLAGHDALREFATHVGSAVFAIPPGAREGGFLAEGAFEARG
jgi:deferrochelatase/peroxidase EfeB